MGTIVLTILAVPPQRIISFRPVVRQKQVFPVRVISEVYPEKLPHLPLDPVRGGDRRRNGVNLRVLSVDQRPQRHDEVVTIEREMVIDFHDTTRCVRPCG